MLNYRVLKSHRTKTRITYMLSWKQCALSVITTMALWQLMHLDTWCTLHIADTNKPKRVLNKLSKEHNISGHNWSTTHRVLKSNRSKMSITYMLSWKQCVLPVITTIALWQLMQLDTWCTLHIAGTNKPNSGQRKEHNMSACWALFGSLVLAMYNHISCAQVHELPQSHCGDNPEGTLFSW